MAIRTTVAVETNTRSFATNSFILTNDIPARIRGYFAVDAAEPVCARAKAVEALSAVITHYTCTRIRRNFAFSAGKPVDARASAVGTKAAVKTHYSRARVWRRGAITSAESIFTIADAVDAIAAVVADNASARIDFAILACKSVDADADSILTHSVVVTNQRLAWIGRYFAPAAGKSIDAITVASIPAYPAVETRHSHARIADGLATSAEESAWTFAESVFANAVVITNQSLARIVGDFAISAAKAGRTLAISVGADANAAIETGDASAGIRFFAIKPRISVGAGTKAVSADAAV